VEYPYFTEPLDCNHIHQADLLGPRYLKGNGRFYSLNIMDLYSHRIFLHPQRRKDDQSVALGLISCWKTMGIPDFLQVDIELCFRGSNRYPRSFGIVIKLCLVLGIEIVFIPIGEPWRNGAIESFNDTYNRSSSGLNGFVTIAISNPSLKTLNSSTIETTDIAVSKAERHHRLLTRRALLPSSHLHDSHCQPLSTSPMEQSHLSVLFEVTKSLMFLESILNSPRTLSILTSELKSLPICIRFRSIVTMSWLPPSLISCLRGSHPNRANRVTYLLTYARLKTG